MQELVTEASTRGGIAEHDRPQARSDQVEAVNFQKRMLRSSTASNHPAAKDS